VEQPRLPAERQRRLLSARPSQAASLYPRPLGSRDEHMSISCWEDREHLRTLAREYPKIGSFIVAFEVRGELGIWLAETGTQGHYSVWGRPADLQRCAQLPAEPV
jgi:hypothetical protein